MRQSPGGSSIQIQEPTLKEIKKHHGWFTGSCLTGCGCIILFIGALYLVFRLLLGSGPTSTTDFPTNFPKDIPQTNPNSVVKIVKIDGQSKERALWVATTIPRFIAGPILDEIDSEAPIIEEKDSLGRVNFKHERSAQDYAQYVFGFPISKNKNSQTVSVTWTGIKSDVQTIVNSYSKILQKNGYEITTSSFAGSQKDDEVRAGFSFIKGETTGTYRAIDLHTDQPGTEYVQLIVNYPAQP